MGNSRSVQCRARHRGLPPVLSRCPIEVVAHDSNQVAGLADDRGIIEDLARRIVFHPRVVADTVTHLPIDPLERLRRLPQEVGIGRLDLRIKVLEIEIDPVVSRFHGSPCADIRRSSPGTGLGFQMRTGSPETPGRPRSLAVTLVDEGLLADSRRHSATSGRRPSRGSVRRLLLVVDQPGIDRRACPWTHRTRGGLKRPVPPEQRQIHALSCS